ncbi:hypothetical protein D3C76_882720 [compost metagenome]
MRDSIVDGSMRSGHWPIKPSRHARSVAWPTPVADSEPYSRTSTRVTWASSPCSRKAWAKVAAARIGPTVWELDGPMPILKRSKTLIAMLMPDPTLTCIQGRVI